MTIDIHSIRRQLNLADNFDVELLRDKRAAAIDFVQRFTGGPIGGFASGTITFGATPPAAGDLIEIYGETFAAILTGPAGDRQFLIGTTPAATASNFVTAIEEHFEANHPEGVSGWFPEFKASGPVVTVTATDMDADANSFTLASSSAHVTVSGPTLTGGAAPAPALEEAVKMLVAHLYENREASLVGVTAQELPFGLWDLLNPFRAWSF